MAGEEGSELSDEAGETDLRSSSSDCHRLPSPSLAGLERLLTGIGEQWAGPGAEGLTAGGC